MLTTNLRTRIAPTPSGYLHLGNVFSFVVTWLIARKAGGRIVLRIDDMDSSRFRLEYLQEIFRCLHQLGLDWDEGPVNAEEALTMGQKSRKDLYEKNLNQAMKRPAIQKKIYGCTCSRSYWKKFSQRHSGWPDGIYPGLCYGKKNELHRSSTSWRIRVGSSPFVPVANWNGSQAHINLRKTTGDFVIRNRDSSPGYHTCSVLDDHYQDINFIVRGKDLLPSSAAQIFLSQLGLSRKFAQTSFLHHGLVVDESGNKLSKSCGSSPIQMIMEKPNGIKRIFNQISHWLSIPETNNLQDLLNHCDFEKIPEYPVRPTLLKK